jgi:glycosyltransferase involved in cell wall biosynthesis
MPRVGRHPLKVKGLEDEAEHREVTVTTIVHIPMLQGDWEQSLDVLKLFFQSLFASTERAFDLMVFDNNSCTKVQDYLLALQRAGKIQYLTLSTYNLRKLGALNYLLSVAPGEYIAYADSDVYFLSGWLDESLNILNVYPQTGQVTALPIVTGAGARYTATLDGIANCRSVSKSEGQNLIPDEFVVAHCESLGQEIESYLARTPDRRDIAVSRDGVKAFVSAADFQYTTTRKALNDVLPLQIQREQDLYYDETYTPALEERSDAAGYWPTPTSEYLVHHTGNTLPDFAVELPWLDFEVEEQQPRETVVSRNPNIKKNSFWQRHSVRSLLKKINTWSYQLLYEK